MADKRKRLANNVSGEFFVDSTCINCDTCRQLAPAIFDDSGEYSYVSAQPHDEAERVNAMRALLACPTGSIGTEHSNDAKQIMQDFPLHIDEGVYYCGFNSPKSYGGNSYFVRHQQGNWLIDSPKYLPHLISQFESMGGVRYIFLTHRDDVAEAARYAERFGSQRIIHRMELSAQPGAEIIIEGTDPRQILDDFLVIPTPGHTRGHCVLLYKNKFLFTGDHMWWSRENNRLGASESFCWYSWPEQIGSTERLLDYDFQWVLTGHGQRARIPGGQSRKRVQELLDWMRRSSVHADDLDAW